jgi:hypothetical protein
VVVLPLEPRESANQLHIKIGLLFHLSERFKILLGLNQSNFVSEKDG